MPKTKSKSKISAAGPLITAHDSVTTVFKGSKEDFAHLHADTPDDVSKKTPIAEIAAGYEEDREKHRDSFKVLLANKHLDGWHNV